MSKKQNTVSPRFVEYFRETFFSDKPDEFESFLTNITKPLPKTIRVNTNRISIEEFKKRADKNGWTLTPTRNPAVFRIDREDTRMPLGHTLEHLLGYFYIQELSASMSVHYLTADINSFSPFRSSQPSPPAPLPGGEGGNLDHTSLIPSPPGRGLGWGLTRDMICTDPYLILDMAASPGGKTTQLAEHFPNAFIIGNEPTRDRTAQLVQNVERMGSDNIALSNYDGIFWGQYPETFDRVLLDAPCSGEGIGFKANESLRYWNIKNIVKIARLQEKLLDAAFRTLRVGGELLYSTCTLNNLENEGVVHAIRSRYPDSFEVLFEKRFWPHLEETGGFFVCLFRKNPASVASVSSVIPALNRGSGQAPTGISSSPSQIPPDSRFHGNDGEKFTDDGRIVRTNEEIVPLSRDELRLVERFSELSWLDLSDHLLYRFRHDILAIRNHPSIKPMLSHAFLIRLGKKIGRIEESVFTPDNRLGRDFDLPNIPMIELSTEELDRYLRCERLSTSILSGYCILRHDGLPVGLESVNEKDGKLTNSFPKEWMRG